MADTYSTNQEIRDTYPQIDNCLPVTKAKGGENSGALVIKVDSTLVFPLKGTLTVLDDNNDLQTFIYDRKDKTNFYLPAAIAFNIADNQEITTGDGALDHFRDLAKAWVDTIFTNHRIPANFRKDLEIHRVFYLATVSSHDPEKRRWAKQIQDDLQGFMNDILRQYPPTISQNIAFLARDGLTDLEKERLRNGPNV